MMEVMRIDRSIGTGPRRSTEQTCLDVMKFITDILHDRGYPDVVKVSSGFQDLFPLLRFLLSTRKLAEPAFTVAMPDLSVDILVSYNPDFEEDLTVPNVVLLDKLTAGDLIQIGVHSTDEVAKPLSSLPPSASTATIQFTLVQGGAPTLQADTVGTDDALPDRDGIVPPTQHDDALLQDRGDTAEHDRADTAQYDNGDTAQYGDRGDPVEHDGADTARYERDGALAGNRDDTAPAGRRAGSDDESRPHTRRDEDALPPGPDFG